MGKEVLVEHKREVALEHQIWGNDELTSCVFFLDQNILDLCGDLASLPPVTLGSQSPASCITAVPGCAHFLIDMDEFPGGPPDQLEEGDLVVLSAFCKAKPEEFENLKNSCTNVMAECGIWSGTLVLSTMVVAITQSQAMANLGTANPDRRITAQGLRLGHPFKLGFTHLASLGAAKKEVMRHEAKLATSFLGEILWNEDAEVAGLETTDLLHQLFCECHDSLIDASFFLNIWQVNRACCSQWLVIQIRDMMWPYECSQF